MERTYSAPIDQVFGLLTDPKWLEARSLALDQLPSKVKARKSGQGVSVSMMRRIKRDMPARVAKVLPAEWDLQFEETWTPAEAGYHGAYSMDIVDQPVRATAEFTLESSGNGCIYRIVHQAKCKVPLLGGAVARYVQAQVETSCAAECAYLVDWLKTHK